MKAWTSDVAPLLLVSLGLCACTQAEQPTASAPKPPAEATAPQPAPIRNVMLISLDTLGAVHSSTYGYERETTPTLDDFAKRGTVFENAYTHQVWTLTSHLTMFTGLYPKCHGASHQRPAIEGIPVLTEILQDAGFSTRAFTGASGYMRPEYGLGRGFDDYEVGGLHKRGGKKGQRMKVLLAEPKLQQKNPDRRFFFFYHSYDPHSDVGTDVPYDSPPAYRLTFHPKGEVWDKQGDTKLLNRLDATGASEKDRRFVNAFYDGGVLFTDREVLGPLLTMLQRGSLLQSTLVIVTSDHGEEIFEHGKPSHQQPYEETSRVPLVFVGPGIPAGLRIEEPVGLVDLAPTILSLLGLEVPAEMQGRDLSPLLRGEDLPERTIFVDGLMGAVPHVRVANPSSASATFDGVRFSYVARIDPAPPGAVAFRVDGDEELFRLDDDPAQERNVIDRHPEVAAELRRRLLDWYAQNRKIQRHFWNESEDDGSVGTPQPLHSEQELEALRALGYIE